MTALRILFASAEAAPFAKVGGLADVVGSLPQALAALGHEVRVALPLYGTIDRATWGIGEPRRVTTVRFEGRDVPLAVHELMRDGVLVQFLAEERYLGRSRVYGEEDDSKRFAFFCRAVVEATLAAGWPPDVIHAHDWHTALVPQLVRRAFADALPSTASVFTIHNLAYQGVTKERVLRAVGLLEDRLLIEKRRFGSKVNAMARGIAFSDAVSTVSERYAQEILTREFGEHLEPLLEERRSDLYGILNGIDVKVFDPATDSHLVANYDADSVGEGKPLSKTLLQDELDLTQDPTVPLCGIVGRLVEQKGVDLLTAVAPDLLAEGVQIAVLGTGEPAYEARWRELAQERRGLLGLTLGFDAALAQRIYAGADLFLMPSRFEPCGLGQMIALRYGTVPVVRSVGGLADTIRDHDADRERGNGFSFGPYTAEAFADAIARALRVYSRRQEWRALQRRGMREDHSWAASARLYVELYETALKNRLDTEVVA